jgi:hypothetical protein
MLWQGNLTRLKNWVNGFFVKGNEEAERRGEESEEKVFKVVQEMLIWKELPTHKKGVHPYRTEKWSTLDRKGVDIVVPTKRGDIYIQVKSSVFGWSRFVKDKRNANIVCINGQNDELTITKELRNKLRIAYERLSSDHT